MVKTPEKGEFDEKVMQANFSAVLYVLTEQQALIGKLLQMLLENGTLNAHQIEKITDIYSGEDGLIPTYSALYKKFAGYYLRTKQILDEDALIGGDDLHGLKPNDEGEDEDNE